MKKAVKNRHINLAKEIEELNRKVCEICDAPFYSNKDYEDKCSVCFKLEKDYKILISDKQCKCLQEELSDCYDELERVEEKLQKAQKQARKYRREAQKQARNSQPSLSDDKILLKKSLQRKLLRLCHPDTHQLTSKKELAQEVTRWLLDQQTTK